MERLGAVLGKFFDNLNVGRLAFYLASGMPATAILFAMLHAVFVTYEMPLRQALLQDFACIVNYVVLYLFVAYIFGFLLSLAAYPVIDKLQRLYSEGYSVPSNVRVLCEGKRDYLDTLLIPEYYRYVEAAVYVPSGILAGSYGFVLYGLLNVLMRDMAWLNVVLWGLLVALVLHLVYFLWYRRVVRRSVRIYEAAKASIIRGLGGRREG